MKARIKILSKTLPASLCAAVLLGLVGVPGAMADSRSKNVSSSSASSVSGLTYTVRSNDSLSGIASKNKVTLDDLLAVNGFKTSSVILPGQVIKLPDNASQSTNGTALVVTSPTNSAENISTGTYTVIRNDSLSGIAAKAKVSLSAFLLVNGFVRTTVIGPGQVVKLPAGAAIVTTTSNSVANVVEVPSSLQKILDFARAQVGKPYSFGTAGPATYDCSGLTKAIFAQIKIALPHQSLMQSKLGTAVDWTSAGIQAGDLVFTFSTRNQTQISHVGIAINSTQWIEAPYTGSSVRISNLPRTDKIQAVRRML